jgi:phytoene synthase
MNAHTESPLPGGSIYYSLLYCDKKSRCFISALHAFYEAVQQISFKCKDNQTAQIKYQWWREEIDRCQSQQARHPVTQILQSYKNFHYTDFTVLLDAFEKDKKISLYEEEKYLNNFYSNTAGLLEKMINQSLEIQDEKILACAQQAGIYIQKISHIRELRTAVTRGKIYFSGENLLLHRVNLYEFSQLKITENIRRLLQTQTRNLASQIQHLQTRQGVSLPTHIRTNIYTALLKEISQSDFPVFTQKIGLTPLRKWWIAWKTQL